MKDMRVVVLGVGAAGVAISKLLLAEGVGDIIGVNRNGIISAEDENLDERPSLDGRSTPTRRSARAT
jgi:malate dehydrogenase (oxaloacetate-decarboxylating)